MPDVFTSSPPLDPPAPQEPDPSTIQKNDAALVTAVSPGNTVHFFSSFCNNPVGISFQGQDPNEVILLFLRRHFITNLPWIFISILLLFIPLIFQFVFPLLGLDTTLSFLPDRILPFLTLFYYLIVAIYIFISFITWYYNISLVTNLRIVDLDFSEVVYKNVAETKVSQVEDANFTQIGALRTFFDYGDVVVQTSAAVDHFDFTAVPHPAHVVNIIESVIGNT